MRPFKRIVLLMLVSALVASCSTAQFFYKRLDWYIGWKVGNFVDLDSGQERAFDHALDRVLQWHRYGELPIYARDLKSVAAAADGPVTAKQIEQWGARVHEHWLSVSRKVLPEACKLMPRLTDAQVASVLEELDDRTEEKVEEYIAPPESEVREESAKKLYKNLKRWFGRVSPTQEAIIHQFSQTRPLHYDKWIASRRDWRESFAAILNQRRSASFCPQLTELVLHKDYSRASTYDEKGSLRLWSDFLADFSKTLDERQRRHFRDALLEVADDFEQLSEDRS